MNRFDSFPGQVLTGDADLICDSFDSSHERRRPDGVALARRAEDVRRMVGWCAARGVPYVARGAGTNLSGGCVPERGGLVISLAPMTRILAVDTERDEAVVESGVVNLRLQEALEGVGRYYAPDPASHKVCTIGGNVGENAGGPRCLKYGVTTNHVRALEAVMPDGSLERFSVEDAGPELMSLLIGSEGTLGVVTKVWLGLQRLPESVTAALAAFPEVEAAMACVSEVIASGILPRTLEAMDRRTLKAVEGYARAGYPEAEAVLLFEVEGPPLRVAAEMDRLRAVCARHDCREFRLAAGAAERERLWEGRRSAYAAMSRLAPSILSEDGVVPRDKLAEAVRRVRAIAADHGIEAALLFHAGDGNLHPNIIYDGRDKELTARVRRAGLEILGACVDLGGSVSGEHGVGIDKRPAMTWLFEPRELELFGRVKRALDPGGLANPEKILPLPGEALPGGLRRRSPPLGEAARLLAEAVREKAARKEPVVVLGTGTKAPKDLRRSFPGHLTTRGLATVIEYDRANFTLRAEAGASLCELRALFEGTGAFLPVPLVPGTLGGLLATKAWPGVRDHVLGMRILLADGTVAELGGKTVKNVAGYDLPRLLLGSWGTLAVILDVTLRLWPCRLEVPNDLPAPPRPRFDRWHRALKGAFDPHGRLNAWVEGT